MGKFVIRKVNSGIKFDLKARNGEVIATSEVYTTEAACRNGIAGDVAEQSTEPEIIDDFADAFVTTLQDDFRAACLKIAAGARDKAEYGAVNAVAAFHIDNQAFDALGFADFFEKLAELPAGGVNGASVNRNDDGIAQGGNEVLSGGHD